MAKLKWEEITTCRTTDRLKVPGGWLVKFYMNNSSCMSFVPDPNHEWIIEKPKKTDGELLEDELVKATLRGSDVWNNTSDKDTYKEQLKDSVKNSCM